MNYNPQIYPPLFGKNKTFRQKIRHPVAKLNAQPYIYKLSPYFLLSERITVKVSKVSMNSFSSAAI